MNYFDICWTVYEGQNMMDKIRHVDMLGFLFMAGTLWPPAPCIYTGLFNDVKRSNCIGRDKLSSQVVRSRFIYMVKYNMSSAQIVLCLLYIVLYGL